MNRSQFSRILLPYDGKEMSDKALEEAVKFAKQIGSHITILYVIDERYARPSGLFSFLREEHTLNEAKMELRRVLSSAAQKMLEEKLGRLKENGISAAVEIVYGAPSEEILKFAESKKFDMMIIGSRSLKSFKKFRALGSVARRVSELSEIPIMLVH